ncbi:hypothetical protein [Streptomyces sp. NPDC005096]|uniref:hypothetical protein n=1 Tax=Streptomyces sp. NPDC005096 TaxID=3154559 RepID=UPI0033A97B76
MTTTEGLLPTSAPGPPSRNWCAGALAAPEEARVDARIDSRHEARALEERGIGRV